jgi:hypothetical protein
MSDEAMMSPTKRLYRLSPAERHAIRDRIAAELSHDPDVLFAYVYGLLLKSEAFDVVDIAVYLSTSHFNNTTATNLSAHLSDKLNIPVNVRSLNTAPIAFRFHVLRSECLFSRDDDLRASIMEDTTRRYLNNASPRRHTTKEAFGCSEPHDSRDSPRTDTEG